MIEINVPAKLAQIERQRRANRVRNYVFDEMNYITNEELEKYLKAQKAVQPDITWYGAGVDYYWKNFFNV
jgi:hypothetical protein